MRFSRWIYNRNCQNARHFMISYHHCRGPWEYYSQRNQHVQIHTDTRTRTGCRISHMSAFRAVIDFTARKLTRKHFMESVWCEWRKMKKREAAGNKIKSTTARYFRLSVCICIRINRGLGTRKEIQSELKILYGYSM